MLINFCFQLVFSTFVAMNIEVFISQLLYRYQCVTVPSFGAFLSETVPANIQENNHTFYPPKKTISFNPYIKNNDGLLANHISQQEKCSYDQAIHIITNQVVVWENKLKNRDFLILKNIGLLRLNSENNIVFEPYDHSNYLTTSFGLSSFVSPTVKREVLKKVVDETILPEINEPAEVEHLDEKQGFNFRKFSKYAATILVTIGASGFGYINHINKQAEVETLMLQKEVQKEVQTKIQEATFFILNPTTTPEALENNKYPFHIVSGSFRNPENANKALSDLIKDGFDARIIEKNDQGLYPVIYGSFTSYPEAQEKLKEIHTKGNVEAWILIKEL